MSSLWSIWERHGGFAIDTIRLTQLSQVREKDVESRAGVLGLGLLEKRSKQTNWLPGVSFRRQFSAKSKVGPLKTPQTLPFIN